MTVNLRLFRLRKGSSLHLSSSFQYLASIQKQLWASITLLSTVSIIARGSQLPRRYTPLSCRRGDNGKNLKSRHFECSHLFCWFVSAKALLMKIGKLGWVAWNIGFQKFYKPTHAYVQGSATRKTTILWKQSFDSPRTLSGDKYFMKTNNCSIQLKFLGQNSKVSLIWESFPRLWWLPLFKSVFVSTHVGPWCHGVGALFASNILAVLCPRPSCCSNHVRALDQAKLCHLEWGNWAFWVAFSFSSEIPLIWACLQRYTL